MIRINNPHCALYPATLLLALLFAPPIAAATPPLWQDINARSPTAANTTQRRTLRLNSAELLTRIQSAAAAETPLRLNLPLPDGSNSVVELQQVATLAPELQQRYPQLKTWRLSSTDARILSGRAELTELGLRISLRSTRGEQWLIEPQSLPKSSHRRMAAPTSDALNRPLNLYQSYQRHTHTAATFSCGVRASQTNRTWPQQAQLNPRWQRKATAQRGSADKLRRYALAISATGEYTQTFNGSKTAAYSAIVSTVNRINEIYEQELGVTLQLVSGTETVFNDPATDPFNGDSLLSIANQNQQVLDTWVGSNRYDIGHVLGAAARNNGVAYVESICKHNRKAQGVTVSNAPLADASIVDYVAHEIGHQLGATHTFNSTNSACAGGRFASTAVEPGSGSTIMSYAGLCVADDLQPNVDPQLHSASIDQIHRILFDGHGASCAEDTTINNLAPRVNAGNDYTIPARTPFILQGSASDGDGDKLLYGWDQLDIGTASGTDIDTANNPLIKSNRLSTNGLRYVPDIKRLLQGQAAAAGESLPRSNRRLNFRLNVRDGKGASSSDDITLSVHDTGSDFRVLSPAGNLSTGEHEIRWQVAGTDQAPINCATVDIAYTNDRGVSFQNLQLKTPNDGSTTIQLSTAAQTLRVKCSDNVFFALSGLIPRIATYRQDNAQPSNANTATTTNTPQNGGGGSLPLHLLLICGSFAAFRRMRSQ